MKLFRDETRNDASGATPEYHADDTAWVAWLYAATARAAPFPSGRYDAASLERIRDVALAVLIDDQITYHKGRRTRFESAERLLVRQSDHMLRIMHRARRRLKELDLKAPLASQDLGSITLGVAIEMLKDVDGWVRLFRVKVLEAS